MFKRILVVCLGNICRSPMAEWMFRDRLEGRDIQVGSAGINALVGQPMDPLASELLREHGIDGSAHRARQVDAAMLREADLVLAMERRHQASLARLAPEASGKIFLLDKWHRGDDVVDPYRCPRSVFQKVHASLERGVSSWLRYL